MEPLLASSVPQGHLHLHHSNVKADMQEEYLACKHNILCAFILALHRIVLLLLGLATILHEAGQESIKLQGNIHWQCRS